MAVVLPLLFLVGEAIALGAIVVVAVRGVERSRQAATLWLLAIVTKRKLPLVDEVEAFADGVMAVDKRKVAMVAERLRGGASLGESLADVPGLVPEQAALLARVGERTGTIDVALRSEAERLLRSAGPAAASGSSPSLLAMYLVAILLLAATILSGIMIFIIPKFKKIFDDFGSRLPAMTEFVIDASSATASYWYLPFALMIAAAWALGLSYLLLRAFGVRLPRLRLPWRGARSSAPVALRALALAAEAGRPLGDGLDPLADDARHPSDRRRFGRLRARHVAGEDVWLALRAGWFVTTNEADLLAAAERAGNLPWALRHVADRLDDRRRLRWAAALEFLQPAVVLAMGLVVAVIVIGLFLPLVQLINDLS